MKARTAAEHSPRIAAEHSPNDINHSFQSDSVPDDASSELQGEGVWREPSPDPVTAQDLSNLHYENAPASSSNSIEKLQKKGTKTAKKIFIDFALQVIAEKKLPCRAIVSWHR